MLRKTFFEYRKIDKFLIEKRKRESKFQALLAPHRVQFDSSPQHCKKLMKLPQKITFVSR